MDIQQIKKEINNILPEIKTIRQHLHKHPELSLKEFNTRAYINEQIKNLNLEIHPPFLETDVVAILNKTIAGRNVTLRADMDALPITETGNLQHKSVNKNVMHACGHDGHTAMLIGAARVLEKFRKNLKGSVRFVFQPGEEIVAAGKALIESGALKSPQPDIVLALHAWPGKPAGSISSKGGAIMAAADFFSIKIKGKGGHGSRPDIAIDPILLANNIMTKIYQLPSRKFKALEPVALSICRISGGSNSNTIPDNVEIEGTCRYFNNQLANRIPEFLNNILKGECEMAGAAYELDYKVQYIPVINSQEVVDKCKSYTKKYLGSKQWGNLTEPVMASEDFSYYIDKNQGAMFFLGMGEDYPALHTNSFDFNDETLFNGIMFLVASTMNYLDD
jgi:amidohydrolase